MARPLPTFSENPVELPDEEVRERLYLAIAAHVIEVVKDKPNLRIGHELGRVILEGVTEALFKTAITHGYMRFPGGYGSMKVQRLKRDAQLKRLPTGEMVPMPPNRVRLRYEEGAAVREALGMPRKTSYVRQFRREDALPEKALALLAHGRKKGSE